MRRGASALYDVPFTPAHAAAALPLSRLWPWLPLPALVIGTMAPDFEYLLRLAPRGRFAHSPLGLLAFCLLMGLLVYAAFECIVWPALLRLLPPGLAAAFGRERVAESALGGAAFGAALAVLLGAVSHVVWDGFTHGSGWAVTRLPALREPVGLALLPRLPWYRLLQHGSTLTGGIVILAWASAWLRRQPLSALAFAPGQAARSARTIATLLLLAGLAGAANGWRVQPTGPRGVLAYAAVGAMSGLAAALLAYGLWAGRHRASRRTNR